MIAYKLREGSHSYDYFKGYELANLFTKEDVLTWATDVAEMISLEAEDNEVIEVNNDIDKALDVLNSANEFLEEVELVGGDLERLTS